MFPIPLSLVYYTWLSSKRDYGLLRGTAMEDYRIESARYHTYVLLPLSSPAPAASTTGRPKLSQHRSLLFLHHNRPASRCCDCFYCYHYPGEHASQSQKSSRSSPWTWEAPSVSPHFRFRYHGHWGLVRHVRTRGAIWLYTDVCTTQLLYKGYMRLLLFDAYGTFPEVHRLLPAQSGNCHPPKNT